MTWEIIIIKEDTGKWRVITAGNGATFDNESEARDAFRLCEASYNYGRCDHARELRKLIQEK